MFKFVLQLFIIALFWFINAKSKRTFLSPSSFLIGIYMVSAAFGIATLYVVDYTEPYYSRYWLPMLVFDLFIILFLYPFKYFNETRISFIKLPRIDILDTISAIIIVLSFYAIFFYFSTISAIFSMDSLKEAREMRYDEGEFFETGIMNTIASVSSSLYVFAIMFFFIYSVIGGHLKRRILLLIASSSEPIHVLAFVGRDGIVFWLFSFVFLYLFFKPFLAETVLKSIRKLFIVVSIIAMIPFALISISRFGEGDNYLYSETIRYIGESFINGPLYFGLNPPPTNIGRQFPLFYELIGSKLPDKPDLIQIGDWASFHFSTFVVSLYQSLDLEGLIILCFFMAVFFYLFIGKIKTRLFAHTLILYMLYFQILSQGVFYFRQCTRGGNLFILLCLIFSLLLCVIEHDEKAVVLINNKKV